ncbi:TetR/AcrR family transcriptional regulator [Microtetraspora fusca]|uniref:TetR/AcrR family transcriptional regulator n=1 Tax=Microtetraspora fusca TaxID=1997 RepID=UPI001FE00DC0|nr:TetR/AcrR family transcriptional regulator [Microtetraspora fusca]
MIVQSALPLIAERGAMVKTSEIAAACGIGEATIFRVFKDKEELLDTCVAEAMRLDTALEVIKEIPGDLPLADRLCEAMSALEAHTGRMARVLGAMAASRGQVRREAPAADRPDDERADERGNDRRPSRPERGHGGRSEAIRLSRAALAELLEPDQERLRMPADQLAGILLSLVFARSQRLSDGSPRVSFKELIDVFLHGALLPEPPQEAT